MSLSGRKCLFKILKLKTNICEPHFCCPLFSYLLYHRFKSADSVLLLIGYFARVAYCYDGEKGCGREGEPGRRVKQSGMEGFGQHGLSIIAFVPPCVAADLLWRGA